MVWPLGYEVVRGADMSLLDTFEKKHDFAVCVDSDGCAMDTMDIKHKCCFGPCMVQEWGLEQWQDAILTRWNEINLYSRTRGINRFKGLAKALSEINTQYKPIEGIEKLVDWAENAPELSNNAVSAKGAEDSIFQKALAWSQAVNKSVEELPASEIKPFTGVKEALEQAHQNCDVIVVSSANPEAVRLEWDRYGLLPFVDLLCTQEMGSKAYCIGKVLEKGYDPAHVLMCGDAPGDEQAATSNGILFYPICVRHETESWETFQKVSLQKLLDEQYAGAYAEEMKGKFYQNLDGE